MRRPSIVFGGTFFTHVILGKAGIRKLNLGMHPFIIAQGDKKEFRMAITSSDEPEYYQKLSLKWVM